MRCPLKRKRGRNFLFLSGFNACKLVIAIKPHSVKKSRKGISHSFASNGIENDKIILYGGDVLYSFVYPFFHFRLRHIQTKRAVC